MAGRIPGYIRKQLPIPGLEGPVKTRVPMTRPLGEQVRALESRIFALELELSLLRIILERGER